MGSVGEMMIMMKDEEEIVHIYHLAIDVLGKLSLQPAHAIEQLQSRFKIEAARSRPDDSAALRHMAGICEVYLNDL